MGLDSHVVRSDSPRIMKRNIIQAGVCFGIVMSQMGGCSPNAPPPQPPPVPSVTIIHPVLHKVIEWDEYTGRLAATALVEVRSRVSGEVVSVPFVDGSIVKKGDVLAEIDARPFQAELDAKSGSAAQAEAQRDLQAIEFHRVQSIPDYARSENEFDTASANLRQAEAALAMAKALEESARLNVEWCTVKAPLDGRIGERQVDPGNLVTGGSGTGTLIAVLVSVDPIYCDVDVDEQSMLKYAAMAREGSRVSARQARIPCYLQLVDEVGFPHAGEVDFVDNRVDPKTGTIRGRGIFPNRDGWLVPGLFARVRVPGSGQYEALLVPDDAIVTDQSDKLLMVVNKDDVVERRPVKLGSLLDQYRAILSGVTPEDRVIVNGLMLARPGGKVKAIEREIPPETLPSSSPNAGATSSTTRRSSAASQPAATATQPTTTTATGGRP